MLPLKNANFSNVTPGYCGYPSPYSTRNSEFFAWFWSHVNGIEGLLNGRAKDISFPQRIPNPEFFHEINRLENAEAATELKSFRKRLAEAASSVAHLPCDSYHVDSVLIPLMAVLARYGLIEEIRAFKSTDASSTIFFKYESQRALLFQILDVDLGISAPFSKLENLAEMASTVDSALLLEHISLVARIVVVSSRFERGQIHARKHAAAILSNLDSWLKFSPKDCGQALKWSTALRGLAMTPGLSYDSVLKLMDRALQASQMINTENKPWSILRDELQATLWQSFAKLYLSRNDTDQAVAAFSQMSHLDPYDSTSHSELGLYFYKLKNHEKALVHFKQAAALGPPATPMNLHLQGHCEKNLGDLGAAERSFLASAKADNLALSPLIELTRLYGESKQISKEREIALMIIENPELREQLDEDETKTVEGALA